MARTINKLSARKVETLQDPGRHGDGSGLYLQVAVNSAKRWRFLFRWAGKLKEMGLRGASGVSLAAARARTADARAVLAEGRNPIVQRREVSAFRNATPTFGAFVDALVPEICKGFRNEKHRAQWVSTLKTHGAPLRDIPIDKVTTDLVLKVLTPIWNVPTDVKLLHGVIP
jgi:hypothetical protein